MFKKNHVLYASLSLFATPIIGCSDQSSLTPEQNSEDANGAEILKYINATTYSADNNTFIVSEENDDIYCDIEEEQVLSFKHKPVLLSEDSAYAKVELTNKLEGCDLTSGIIFMPDFDANFVSGNLNLNSTSARPVLKLVRSKVKTSDNKGGELLLLKYLENGKTKAIINSVSGTPKRQSFRIAPRSQRGSYEPIPEGIWGININLGRYGIRWAGKAGNYNTNWSGTGFGPIKVTLDYKGKLYTERSAILIHEDANRKTSPGTAGCVGVLPDLADAQLKKLVSWFPSMTNAPKTVIVDYNLGFVKQESLYVDETENAATILNNKEIAITNSNIWLKKVPLPSSDLSKSEKCAVPKGAILELQQDPEEITNNLGYFKIILTEKTRSTFKCNNNTWYVFASPYDSKKDSTLPPENTKLSDIDKKIIAAGYVNLKSLNQNIDINLKYSLEDNFFKQDVYANFEKCYLLPDVANRLNDAQKTLSSEHPDCKIVMWDCLRPNSIQEKMWKIMPDQKYVAKPYDGKKNRGSLHSRGTAIDISINCNEEPIDMGSKFDEFTDLSKPSQEKFLFENNQLTNAQITNRNLLRDILEEQGFSQNANEWWHFDAYNSDMQGFSIFK